MATRLKTIQFAVQSSTTLIANVTVTNLAQITAYIPETVISFESVTCEVFFADIVTATGGTITEHRVACSVGGSAYTTITETDDITHSGENVTAVMGPFDFTALFTSAWTSGTSKTLDTQVYFNQSTGTTLGMQSVSAVYTITYLYNDDPAVNATQIKTAWIPLESNVTGLPTVANSNLGSNQIPQLTGTGGFLPEAGVTIRGYSFILEGNSIASVATDFTTSVNIDAGTKFDFAAVKAALASECFYRYVWSPTVPTTTAAHNFQLWTSLAGRFGMMTVTLVVTYEFTPATSTRILNSLLLPIELSSPLGGATAALASRFSRTLMVQEPGTITLKQSAFRINWNVAATPGGPLMRAGGQAYRTYTNTVGVACGMYCAQQRIDSGGAQGAGITLARGSNNFTIDAYQSAIAQDVTNVNGFITLNYHSDKAASGLVGQHAHTTMRRLSQWDMLLTDRSTYSGYSFPIPEADYWLVGVGFNMIQLTNVATMAVTFDTEVLTGEGKGGGYLDIYADAYQSDAELNCSVVWMRGRDVFKRYPTDPDPDRLDIEAARTYRQFTSFTTGSGLNSIVSYHSFAYSTTLTVAGSAGGSVTTKVFRSDTDEKIGEYVRTGNGTIAVKWYDNTIDCYAVSYENGTHLNRSANFKHGD